MGDEGEQGERHILSAYFLAGNTEKFVNVCMALREPQIEGTKKKVLLCVSKE